MPLAGFLHMAGFKDRTHDLRTRAGAGSSGFGVALIVGDALLLQGGGLLAAAVAVDGDHGGDAEPDAGGGAMSAATLPVSMAGPCRVISDKDRIRF